MNSKRLRRQTPDEVTSTRLDSLDQETLDAAQEIVRLVKSNGDGALVGFINRFEERTVDKLIFDREELRSAFERLSIGTQEVLVRTSERIRSFAQAQMNCLSALDCSIPGGRAGHSIAPVKRAACYAPGGRFPLPSSVLMTAVTAKVADVADVVVVTPSRHDVMLGAAYVAGADSLLHCGGAHAVAAVAYGTESIEAADVIVGPGNRWVTAAKYLVSGIVGIDMLAGPSELVVVADESADACLVASDLLAQAEHDPDARPILVTTSETLIDCVELELERQLKTLDTRHIAEQSLSNGAAILCQTEDEAIEVTNALAPEHLELMGNNFEILSDRFEHYGGLFVGTNAAEVLGDYGAGPNHVLPTGGTSRFSGGLSVFNFIRIRTWMRMEKNESFESLIGDTATLAGLEGLSGHAQSALQRLSAKV